MITKIQTEILKTFPNSKWLIVGDLRNDLSLTRKRMIEELEELVKLNFLEKATIVLRTKRVTKYLRTKKEIE